MKRIAFALIASMTAVTVLADDAATTAAAPATAKADCAKPDIPGKFATETQFKAFNRHFKEYQDCVKAFAEKQNAIAQAAIKAGNEAINEANDFAKQVNERSQDQ